MTGPATGLDVGDEAPDFDLPDSAGGRTRLTELLEARGGAVVYFFPKAFTSGCTIEVGDFSAHGAELAEAGLAVVGVSRDEPDRLADFARMHDGDSLLVSDADSSVHRAYGVLAAEKVRRTTFLLGPDRTVRRAWHDVSVEGHVAEVLGAATGG